jgi:hypothetical protein
MLEEALKILREMIAKEEARLEVRIAFDLA